MTRRDLSGNESIHGVDKKTEPAGRLHRDSSTNDRCATHATVLLLAQFGPNRIVLINKVIISRR